jgi:hypothetical protein
MTQKPVIRCAIYTRKSSDEGLDQAFNSLDAQYEACAAYIASQRHEGWKLALDRFDDGGLPVAHSIARPCSAFCPRLMPGASAWSSSTRSTG